VNSPTQHGRWVIVEQKAGVFGVASRDCGCPPTRAQTPGCPVRGGCRPLGSFKSRAGVAAVEHRQMSGRPARSAMLTGPCRS